MYGLHFLNVIGEAKSLLHHRPLQSYRLSLSQERCSAAYLQNQTSLMRTRTTPVTDLSNVSANTNQSHQINELNNTLNRLPLKQDISDSISLTLHFNDSNLSIIPSVFDTVQNFLGLNDFQILAKTYPDQPILLQRIKYEWSDFLHSEGKELESFRIWILKNIDGSSANTEKNIHDFFIGQKRQELFSKQECRKQKNAAHFVIALTRLMHNDFSTPIIELLKSEISLELLEKEETLKKLEMFGGNHKNNRYELHFNFLADFFKKKWLE